MGDIAEAMLDGTLCNVCGAYLGDATGYPGTCPGCHAPSAPMRRKVKGPGGRRPMCPECQRQFNTRQGLSDHRRDVHGAGGAPVSNKLIGQRMEARAAMLVLDRAGVPFRTSNNGVHIQIRTARGLVDYWPTTGRWHLAGKHERGDLMEFLRGVKYMRQEPLQPEPKGQTMKIVFGKIDGNKIIVRVQSAKGVALLEGTVRIPFPFALPDLFDEFGHPLSLHSLATNWPIPIPDYPNPDATVDVYPQDYLDKCAELRAVAAELDRLGVPAGTVAERMALFRERADELMQAEVDIERVDAALDEAGVPKVMEQESEDEDAGGNLVSFSETVPACAADRVSMLARMMHKQPAKEDAPAREAVVNIYPESGRRLEVQRLTGPAGHVTINVTICPQAAE